MPYLTLIAALIAAPPLAAHFNPERAYQQSEAEKHYPEPALRFDTPGFAPGKADFTSHRKTAPFVARPTASMAANGGHLQVRVIG